MKGVLKLNEIRLGNKILHEGKIYIVDAKMMYAFFSGKIDYDIDNFEPIPLTEEWLIEKMKFHKQNNQIYSIGLKLFISWWNTNSIEIDINGEVLIINCKYVHELQNIYFALTGEELELKVDALQ